jgi:small subunit ribosomal protein S6
VKLYESMFLLDNQAVRAGWKQAKASVTDVLGKHGARVATARRYDERKLAYPIRGRRRGTYLLAYYEIDPDQTDGLRRELDLSETVLRYLQLAVEAIPEGEQALSEAELSDAFEIPQPPEDVEPELTPEEAEVATAAEDEEVMVLVEEAEATEAGAAEAEEEA